MRFSPIPAKFCAALVDDGDIQQKILFAINWLDMWLSVEMECGKRGVIVFDIDDTLINRGGKPLPPVVALYKKCLALGLRCAIVTARPDIPGNRAETIRLLRQHGITNWDVLHLMPVSHTHRAVTAEEISAYKQSKRDEIARHVPILANIGDMWTDLFRFPLEPTHDFVWRVPNSTCCILFPPHSHSEVAIKLPNY